MLVLIEVEAEELKLAWKYRELTSFSLVFFSSASSSSNSSSLSSSPFLKPGVSSSHQCYLRYSQWGHQHPLRPRLIWGPNIG